MTYIQQLSVLSVKPGSSGRFLGPSFYLYYSCDQLTPSSVRPCFLSLSFKRGLNVKWLPGLQEVFKKGRHPMSCTWPLLQQPVDTWQRRTITHSGLTKNQSGTLYHRHSSQSEIRKQEIHHRHPPNAGPTPSF